MASGWPPYPQAAYQDEDQKQPSTAQGRTEAGDWRHWNSRFVEELLGLGAIFQRVP
jgi:hypothetical protein